MNIIAQTCAAAGPASRLPIQQRRQRVAMKLAKAGCGLTGATGEGATLAGG
ncbi:MAG: hypothetical protein H7337_18585 [Rhizobacter sp.]|nr:hypothetical protein [Rhizobacter sp.]